MVRRVRLGNLVIYWQSGSLAVDFLIRRPTLFPEQLASKGCGRLAEFSALWGVKNQSSTIPLLSVQPQPSPLLIREHQFLTRTFKSSQDKQQTTPFSGAPASRASKTTYQTSRVVLVPCPTGKILFFGWGKRYVFSKERKWDEIGFH